MTGQTRTTCVVVISTLLLVLTGYATQGEAGVNINVGDGGVNVNVGGEGVKVTVGNELPAISFATPPELVVIPGTYVYLVPDIDTDVLFFQGYWWRPYEGNWYRARDYSGQWSYVEPGIIPRGLSSLPKDYRRRLSPGYERIPHRDVEKNWERWEKEKYWDRLGEPGHGDHDGYRDDNRRGDDNRR